MSITENILTGIKQAITEGEKVTVDIREASALTGSGTGKGGRLVSDDAFATLRYLNPLRQSARVIPVKGSDAMFVAKNGNVTNPTNPWGYAVNNNVGTPNLDTVIWQLPVRTITAQVPVRSAVLSDVNNLQPTIIDDIMLEFSVQEGLSMCGNNDQSGSTTTTLGATDGLRGLDSYTSGSASAYGTSGTAITNGIHTIATQSFGGVTVTYNGIAAMPHLLPGQYWSLPGTAWYIKPSLIETLRTLKDSQGLPLFLETGDEDGAAVGRMFGWPVIPNAQMTTAFPVYLANWPRFLTIGDAEEMSVQLMDQTTPGFVTLYCEKRVVSTVRDPFAGVRASAA